MGDSLDAAKLRQRLPFEVGDVAWRDPDVHAPLEIAVEVLVGIRRREAERMRPYRPEAVVNGCGHGVEVIPVPDEDGVCDLVPVLEISVEDSERLVS